MKYITITVLSIILTVSAGLFLPKTFDSREEFYPATFGFPLPIFSQTLYNNEKVLFPATISLGSPWEYPVTTWYENLLIDIVLFWIVLYMLWWGRCKLHSKNCINQH